MFSGVMELTSVDGQPRNQSEPPVTFVTFVGVLCVDPRVFHQLIQVVEDLSASTAAPFGLEW